MNANDPFRKNILSLYKNISLMDKIHIWIRYILCPFNYLETYLPQEGRVLDFGCGHGIFANLMALKSEKRDVVGIDPSITKIEAAQKSIDRRQNIKFIKTEFEQLDEGKFTAITMIDVLYLIHRNEQDKILSMCRAYLDKGGLLMIKETVAANSLRFATAFLEEWIMVKILKKTLGESNFYYRTEDEWVNLLMELGYHCKSIKLKTFAPSCLFLCSPK